MELLTNEQLLEKGVGAVQQLGNKFQQFQQQVKQATPFLDPAENIVNKAMEAESKLPSGVAQSGATTLVERGLEALNISPGFAMPLLGLVSVKGAVRLRPKGTKNIGIVGDPQGRRVEQAVAAGETTGLKNRDLNAMLATDWQRSRQRQYQQRYAQSRDVKAQAHHIGDHEFFGQAKAGPDKEKIDLLLNKKGVTRQGNDAANMVDAWGWEPGQNIYGKDHLWIHEELYPKLPARQTVEILMKEGKWQKFGAQSKANLLARVYGEKNDIVMRWANWKLSQIYRAHPELKVLPPAQLRSFVEQNPEEVARLGSMAQMPTYKQLMKTRKPQNNDFLRKVFGFSD